MGLRLLIAEMIGPINIEIANAERLLAEVENEEDRQFLTESIACLKNIKKEITKLKGK